MVDQTTTAWYPKTGTLNIDVTKIGTIYSTPFISFYIKKHTIKDANGIEVHLETGHADYFYQDIIDLVANDDEWCFISLPIGSYYNPKEVSVGASRVWSENGAPDWNDIDYIAFKFTVTGGTPDGYIWIDDLKLRGVVTRSAYDSIKIGTQKCKILPVRDDIAKGDILDSAVDTGQIAQFAKAELARAISEPITGNIQIPLYETIQAGQLCHIHACKQVSGSYRIDSNFRIIEARHFFGEKPNTKLLLTDDIKSSHPVQPTDAYEAIVKASKIYFQDRTRATILSSLADPKQTILATDYNTAAWF